MNEDAIDRKLVCAFIDGLISDDGERKKGLEYIRSMPPVNPIEPCSDAIDRAKAIKIADGYCHPANVAKELAKLPSVNPQPCEDAISRQAVIDMLDNAQILSVESGDYCGYCTEDIDIESIPSVNPQPKTGYWIGIDGKPSHLQDGMTTGSVWCSECGKWLTASDEYSCDGKYCPNCGAKMVEPQERSDKK